LSVIGLATARDLMLRIDEFSNCSGFRIARKRSAIVADLTIDGITYSPAYGKESVNLSMPD